MRLDRDQHVPNVRVRVDRVQSAGRNDGLDDRKILSVLGAAGKQRVLSANCNNS